MTVVAIENVLAEFYTDLGMPGETELAALSALMRHLESLKQENKTEHNRLVDRAKSAIGGLKNASAPGRLRDLLSSGVVSENGVDA